MEKQTMWRLVWSQVQEASKPLMTDRGKEEWTMYGPPSRMWQPDPDHFTATVSLEKLADCDEWEHVDSETAKAPTAPTRSRSTRPRLGCWNVTGWRTRTFPTKSNRGEPKSGTLEVRRCITLH